MEMLVGETWRSGSDTTTWIDVTDPQDGSLIDRVPRATLADLEAAAAQAARAARTARKLPAHQRVGILEAVADRIEERSSVHAEMIAREGIKTIREARREVWRCTQTLRLSAEEARRPTGSTLRFDQRPGSERRVGYWFREPVGVVAAITPFNDPLNLVAHKVGPAIAAGNSVIVKPHSETPLSSLLLAEAFVSAGLPPGILQVVTGPGSEIGQALAGHPSVSMVTFTGGNRAGMSVALAAAGKRTVLELGSNCPVIVMPDADLDQAAEAAADGAFGCAGQNCLHVQRIIVHRSVADELRLRLVAAASEIRLGDKLDETTEMGPLINEASADRVEAMIEDAVARGGKLLVGGERQGTRIGPTLIDELPSECRLARDEAFGPVAGILEVDSFEAAIEAANATDYGLHAGIFTSDINTAMRAIQELQCGGVMVNDSGDYRIDGMPFGGVKGSGVGREGVASAFEEMTTTKVACFNL
jgi:glyceraldehyde-3-phosphate dehydrogenase (NADP+)